MADFGGSESLLEPSSRRTPHPVACFFHLFFKVGALLAYLFCTLFSSNFVLNFVVTILLVAFDFWVVKNVTGRLLVGLRWWNEVKEDGTSEWIFESREDNTNVSSWESRLFWLGLVIPVFLWVVLGIMSFFTPKWLLVVVVALILSCTNIYGYLRCAKDARKNLTNLAGRFVAKKVAENPEMLFTAAGAAAGATSQRGLEEDV